MVVFRQYWFLALLACFVVEGAGIRLSMIVVLNVFS